MLREEDTRPRLIKQQCYMKYYPLCFRFVVRKLEPVTHRSSPGRAFIILSVFAAFSLQDTQPQSPALQDPAKLYGAWRISNEALGNL